MDLDHPKYLAVSRIMQETNCMFTSADERINNANMIVDAIADYVIEKIKEDEKKLVHRP